MSALGATDLKQVGLPKRANEQLRDLVENHDAFGMEQDVYRLAVAVAVALGLRVSEDLRRQETSVKWRVTDDLTEEGSRGSRLDDPHGTLAKMVATFCPEYATAPYRYSQYLATMGINYLHGRLFDRGMSLSEALRAIADRVAQSGERGDTRAG